jgi:RING-variant domain
MDDRRCRICLEENDTDEKTEENGKLIAPCECKGTMKYVHSRCLNLWRLVSDANDAFYHCTSCGYAYKFHGGPLITMVKNRAAIAVATILFHALLLLAISHYHCGSWKWAAIYGYATFHILITLYTVQATFLALMDLVTPDSPLLNIVISAGIAFIKMKRKRLVMNVVRSVISFPQ